MGAVQVQAISGSMEKQQLTGPASMTVRRNGWLYVYVSNESNQDVYFDDLIVNHQRGPVVEQNNYYAFGMEIPGLGSKAIGFGGSNDNRIKYNGKELQSKEFNDGGGLTWEDYGARMYDPQIGRWHSVDPLTEDNRNSSPFSYCFNNPLLFIDENGMFGDYYRSDGSYLGNDENADDKAYVVKDEAVISGQTDVNTGKTSWLLDRKGINDLGISNTTLIAFASLIDNESSGARDESYAIGNVTMNFLKNGGSTDLRNLEDVSLYKNSFARGATQDYYTDFKGKSKDEQNSKFALGAAINAVGYNAGLQGFPDYIKGNRSFSDYSGGANTWDGIDLISTKWSNAHRNYTWSTGSKELLTQFKNDNNGGIKVAGFKYKDTGYQISASRILGKTLYTNVVGGRGEGKKSDRFH